MEGGNFNSKAVSETCFPVTTVVTPQGKSFPNGFLLEEW